MPLKNKLIYGFFLLFIFLVAFCLFPRTKVLNDPRTFEYGWIDENIFFLKSSSDQINRHYFARKNLIENKQTFNVVVTETKVVRVQNIFGVVYKENRMSRTYSCGTWMPRVDNDLKYVEKSSEAVMNPRNLVPFRAWLDTLNES